MEADGQPEERCRRIPYYMLAYSRLKQVFGVDNSLPSKQDRTLKKCGKRAGK